MTTQTDFSDGIFWGMIFGAVLCEIAHLFITSTL